MQDKGTVQVQKSYINAVIAAGGVPLVLPNKPRLEEYYLNALDGILFSGGGDIAAKYFNQENHEKVSGISEERDQFELALAKLAIEAKKPVMGICRGHQLLNVALGGDLIQHIEDHSQKDARHAATHYVDVVKGTNFHKWVGQDRIWVNTYHHQLVGNLGKGLVPTCHSPESYIEGYEYAGTDWFCFGVQWHPEALLESPEHLLMMELFRPFIEACKK